MLRERYPTRGPVLVDEAHNFRNINNRSAGLRAYLDDGDHKVVLLSATPQNLGPRDIYRQLRLFLDETEHGLNIEPLGLEAYFRCAEAWHKHRADYENYTDEYRDWEEGNRKGAPPIPPDKPSVPRADIEQVLTPVFIRRRRKDITELYGDSAEIDGKPVRFPEPRLSNTPLPPRQGVREGRRLQRVAAAAGRTPGDSLQGHRLHQAGGERQERVRGPVQGAQPHSAPHAGVALQTSGIEHRGVSRPRWEC